MRQWSGGHMRPGGVAHRRWGETRACRGTREESSVHMILSENGKLWSVPNLRIEHTIF